MPTAATMTVVCPGCRTSQDASASYPGADLSVVACLQCQANLILVPQGASDRTEPCPGQRTIGETPVVLAPSRSAIVAVSFLCLLSYLTFGSLLYGASYGIKQWPPYKTAESFIAHHPLVRQQFGGPLKFGWFPTAHLRTHGRKSTAYVNLSLSGPHAAGHATLFLEAERDGWRVREARYQIGQETAQALWVQFPGDYDLLNRLQQIMSELDQATNDRDVDGMMKHLAPDVRFRVILELPPSREVRTFNTRDDIRRETLAGILMMQDIKWIRHETEFRLAPDGQTAIGKSVSTQKVTANGRHTTFGIEETITYSFESGRPSISSLDRVQQIKKPS